MTYSIANASFGYIFFEGWTRAETEHLLDLCGRFDLRFTVIQDRWDRATHPRAKSIEDLKVTKDFINLQIFSHDIRTPKQYIVHIIQFLKGAVLWHSRKT